MNTISPKVKFLLNAARTQSILIKRFDKGMGNGISFNEFLILFYLNQANEKKMRRVDLAEKVGMTASGVTRMLLPMEKIGLIKSGPVDEDARVRSVSLSAGGKEKLVEALERLEILAGDIIPDEKSADIQTLSDLLIEIGGRILMQ